MTPIYLTQFNLVVYKDCTAATLSLKSSITDTFTYQIDSTSSTASVYSIDIFESSDPYCDFVYSMRYDSTTPNLYSAWTDNNYALGAAQTADDFVWYTAEATQFSVETDDNLKERSINAVYTSASVYYGAIKIIVQADIQASTPSVTAGDS